MRRAAMKDCSSCPNLDNKNLAWELYSRLPRELRNYVYAFCVEGLHDNEVIVRRAAYPKGEIVHLVREYSGSHSYQWIEDPISSFMSTQNLGIDVASEMLEIYYWTRNFKFSHRELSLVAPFLKADIFGLGMRPACYARRLQIQIQPNFRARPHRPEEKLYEEGRYFGIIKAVGAILTTRTEIAIDIDLAEGLGDDDDCSRIYGEVSHTSPTVSSVVTDLEGRGMRVKMIYSQSWDGSREILTM